MKQPLNEHLSFLNILSLFFSFFSYDMVGEKMKKNYVGILYKGTTLKMGYCQNEHLLAPPN
jgi:hypothetical protein